jgi:nucleoside-diphosphate-sugar epimerase
VQVFLTGATGFIGRHLAAALTARGHRLRCLVRSPDSASALIALGAELVVGDAADEGALAEGMRGAAVAWQVAGRYDLGRVDAAAMEHVNVAGTRAFLSVLRRSAVGRGIHVSSTAALGPVVAGEGNEQSEYHGPYPSVYHRTKTEAHHMALAAQADGVPVTVVCPALVYGPGDEGPSGRYVRDLLRHRVPGLSTRPAWFSYAHVGDVVQGMIEAGIRRDVSGTYVLSGEHATVNRFTAMIVALAGTWGPPLRIPPALVRATGSVLDLVSRVSGVRLPISRELADVAATGERWVHSHARATAELDYRPRSLAEGLPETVRSVQAELSST